MLGIGPLTRMYGWGSIRPLTMHHLYIRTRTHMDFFSFVLRDTPSEVKDEGEREGGGLVCKTLHENKEGIWLLPPPQ